MGRKSAPVVQDNSAEVARINADLARENRNAEEQRRQQEQQAFEQRLQQAFQGAVGGARNFFTDMGVDPEQYMARILDTANSARAMVPQGAQEVGSFFDGIGQRAFDTAQSGERNQALRTLNSFTPEGFYRSLIGDNALQDTQQATLLEQQERANQFVNNLAARGILGQTGTSAALQGVTDQKARANRQLSEIATALLESGRGDLRDIATRGRSAASNLSLGQQFDPFSYQQQINDRTRSFFDTLGDNFRSFVPENLFDTSGLVLRGGRAQGAQNTPFNPAALAGIFGEDDEDDKSKSRPSAPLL